MRPKTDLTVHVRFKTDPTVRMRSKTHLTARAVNTHLIVEVRVYLLLLVEPNTDY